MRSPTSRDIRSDLGRAAGRASRATSSASSGSRSSRWPRRTVSGVLSSWPASSRNWRWSAKPDSSRSSIEVDGAGQRGDVVVALLGDPPGQVGRGDVARRLLQGAQRGQQPPRLEGGDGRDQAQRQQRHEGVGAQRPVELLVLVGEEVDDHQGALALGVAAPAPRSPRPRRTRSESMTSVPPSAAAGLDGALVGRLVEDRLAVAVGGAFGRLAPDVADQHLVVVGHVAGQEDVEHPADVVEGARRSAGRCAAPRNSAISWSICSLTARSMRADSRA